MPESTQLRIRISEEMRAELAKRAAATKKTVSEVARAMLAKSLQKNGLDRVQPEGRPKISEKS